MNKAPNTAMVKQAYINAYLNVCRLERFLKPIVDAERNHQTENKKYTSLHLRRET